MANLEELVVTLTAETAGLKAELANAAKATKEATGKMQEALDGLANNSKKNLSFFETALATLTGFLGGEAIKKGLSILADGVKTVADQLKEGAHAAIEQEAAFQKLANSLQLTGQYTSDAQKELEKFSDEMEGITGVNDEVIASNLALLSSMTKLDSDGLQQAEKAALALSAAFNVDLDTAVRMVGKGIEGNVESFKKFGISVQEGTDKASNLANILAAIPLEAANAKLNTFAGSANNLSNSFGNLSESIASVAIKNPVLVAMMNELSKIFKELTAETDKSAIAFREDLAEAVLSLVQVMGVSLLMFDAFIKGLQVVGIAAYRALGGLDSWKQGIEEINAVLEKQSIFEKTAEDLARIQESGSRAFGDIKTSADAATPTIKGTAAAVRDLTEAEKAHREEVKQFGDDLAKQGKDVEAQYKFREDVLKAAMENESITKEEYFAAQQEINAAQFETENAMLDENRSLRLMSETDYQAAKTALAQKQATEEMAIMAQKTAYEKEQQKVRAQNLKDSFSYIATLSTSGNATLAAIGKAAAITTATIDGYAAVQKALAAAPPPFNFALAALVGTATAANVAKIAGVGLATGITEVPRSAGGGNGGDNFPAILQSGERVVDSQTNQDLKGFLANQGNAGGPTSVTFVINIAPGTGITREQAAQIVDGINDYTTSGGLGLITG